jgi:DNA-binding NtrC family response regulator
MSARILVVDDDEAVSRAICRTLRQAGFETAAIHQPHAALEQMRAEDFAVVISDQRMPQCSGVEFLEICAREFPITSQILITGYADPSVPVEAINRTEVMRYLYKPWTTEELVAAVREAVWMHDLRRQE